MKKIVITAFAALTLVVGGLLFASNAKAGDCSGSVNTHPCVPQVNNTCNWNRADVKFSCDGYKNMKQIVRQLVAVG